MPLEQSPAEFARNLREVGAAVKKTNGRAIAARAVVTKRYIVAAALAANHHARPGWVEYRIAGAVATLRLRTGFAFLTERGSYKHPEGWEETPRKRSTATALSTPYGPRASVMHPALRARPFWEKGLNTSRLPGHNAYQKIQHDTIVKALR